MVHYKITMFYKKSLAQAGLASEEATKRINIIEKAMVSFIFNFHSQDKRVMSSHVEKYTSRQLQHPLIL